MKKYLLSLLVVIAIGFSPIIGCKKIGKGYKSEESTETAKERTTESDTEKSLSVSEEERTEITGKGTSLEPEKGLSETEKTEIMITDVERIAKELWDTIHKENYKLNWKLWPDTEDFHKGRKPHGELLTTYVNDIAYDAIKNKKGKLDAGSIIITENYTSDRNIIFVTVMQKINGFNPLANDWFWVKYETNGEITAVIKDNKTLKLAGNVADCIECHILQTDNDYLYTSPIIDIEKVILDTKKKEEEIANVERLAAEIWNKIKSDNYPETWKMWPGKEAFYNGIDPHGTLLNTYVNEVAYESIIQEKESIPYDAVIVTENYMFDKNLEFITVMKKIKGFDPENNDWFWIKFKPNGAIITEEKYGETIPLAGKVDTCITCHKNQSLNDYIYTSFTKGITKKEITEEKPEGTERVYELMAKELWEIMQNEKYRENWKMWPGKTAFYEGTEPHGFWLTTYVNDLAHEAIKHKKGELQPGAIIIKENYRKDKNIDSITVMQKIKGFDPDAKDWFWVKYEPNGDVMVIEKEEDGKTKTIKLAGKLSPCIKCHGTQTSNDYIMTTPLKLLHTY
ncbi:MAG: cytochrome P460 family protein [Candidatus Kuenenia sp.]|nr:cytochrome P460 family protein [Candidatus Kuenenia hertensis]